MSNMVDPNQTKEQSDTPTVRNGERYLLRIKQPGVFFPKDGGQQVQAVRGELHLSIANIASDQVYVKLIDFGLMGASVPTARGETGLISFRGRAGAGMMRRAGQQWQIELFFQAEYVSEQIERTFGFPIQVDEHGFNSPPERFKCILTGDVVFRAPRTDEPAGEVVFELHNGRMQFDLDFAEGNLGTITSLWIQPLDEPVIRVFSGLEMVGEVACRLATPRRLRLQAVGFQDGRANTTGQSVASQKQFVKAAEAWGKACISFIEQPIELKPDPTAQFTQALAVPLGATRVDSEDEGNHVEAAAATFSASESVAVSGELLAVVDVFFVADPLLNSGGAVHLNGTSALAKIVLTEQNGGDACLLAHELGHVFGGLHAGTPAAAGEWTGDNLTVMAAVVPHWEENTEHNCTGANNAAVLETLSEACCMTPDEKVVLEIFE